MNDVYQKIEEYNPNKKDKILLVFDVRLLSNIKLNPKDESIIWGTKLSIPLVFIMQFYFPVPKRLD